MRVSFRNRNLGHPLLTPSARDYTSGGFDMDEPDARNVGNGVSVRISYRLESDFLKDLVDCGDAAFQTLITCAGSFLREATPKTAERTQFHSLEAGKWTGVVEMMPYVTATKRIAGFANDEHHAEFRIAAPDGFAIEPSMILAIGNIHEIDMDETASASSVIDVQPKSGVDAGLFELDLANPHIMVYVSHSDFPTVRRTIDDRRESRSLTMWPSVYLHVITEGIRNLGEHEEYAWSAAFARALSKNGFNPEDAEDLRENALLYAQRIVYDEKKRYPLGMMLEAFAEEDADPREDDDI